ncbi:hypothetical protein [Streptomyces sp. NPDC003877]
MTSREQPHGHVNTYKNGCRCAACREANSAYQAAGNVRRKADPSLADRAGHGKRSTYVNYACRCTACCTASSAAQRAARARRKEQAK